MTFKRIFQLFVSVLVAFSFSCSGIAAPKLKKASWLWEAAIIEQPPPEFYTFLQRERVTDLYVQVHPHLQASVYRPFIARLAQLGVAAHALGGEPQWATTDKRALRGLATWQQWIRDYMATAQPNERFRGVHLDIEPYLLPQWKTEKRTLIARQVAVIRLVKGALRLPMSIAVPFWHDTKTVAQLMNVSDEYVVMAYRSSAEQLVAITKPLWPLAKKRIVIAVETITSEAPRLSFGHGTKATMAQELATATKTWRTKPNFAGLAYHHIESWRQMR